MWGSSPRFLILHHPCRPSDLRFLKVRYPLCPCLSFVVLRHEPGHDPRIIFIVVIDDGMGGSGGGAERTILSL